MDTCPTTPQAIHFLLDFSPPSVRCLLKTHFLLWLKEIEGSGRSCQKKKKIPLPSLICSNTTCLLWALQQEEGQRGTLKALSAGWDNVQGSFPCSGQRGAWWQLLFGGIWLLLEFSPPPAFSLLGLFVVAWPSVCYVMFIKDLKEQGSKIINGTRM